MLKHDGLDTRLGSLEHIEAQILLLQVDVRYNQELRVAEEVQADGLVQDSGLVRDDDERTEDDGAVICNEESDDGKIANNIEVQELDSIECTVSICENPNLKDSVQSAFVSPDDLIVCFKKLHMVELGAHVIPPKTTIPLDVILKHGTGRMERIDHVKVPKASPLDLLGLLTEHKDIADRIMSLLFPGDSINICEYAKGERISPHHKHQVKYDVTDRNSRNLKRSLHKTTYFASHHPDSLDVAKITILRPEYGRPFCDFNPRLLRVSKAFHKLGLKYLYGRSFRLQCSATGAHNFLMDHSWQVHLMTQLELFFHFQVERGALETDGEEWHKLLRKIRHRFSYIPKIYVHVGHGFWAKARMRIGHAVICQ